jgi:hypothetical protein
MSQSPQSLFSQFTEDERKKISESFKFSVNWTEYNKWLKEGQPFEEHEEIELFINREIGSSQGQISASLFICVHFTASFLCIYLTNFIF